MERVGRVAEEGNRRRGREGAVADMSSARHGGEDGVE
jgi:hypothetical protein